jgi:hypothetical protein
MDFPDPTNVLMFNLTLTPDEGVFMFSLILTPLKSPMSSRVGLTEHDKELD